MKNNKKLLLELICDEQIRMLEKDSHKYKSKKYRQLEELKIILNDLDLDESRITALKLKQFESRNINSSEKYKSKFDAAFGYQHSGDVSTPPDGEV